MQNQNDTANANITQQFEIQRIYVKDISFETSTPQIFREEWRPEVNLNLETKSNKIEEHIHEVVLAITATVTSGKKNAFLVEVQQAGVFKIQGINNDELHHALGSFCPNILFPYAREVISDVVVRGGFPQLILAPVNFDALYAEHMSKKDQQTAN